MTRFPHRSVASRFFASCFFRVAVSELLHFHSFLLADTPTSLLLTSLPFHISCIRSAHATLLPLQGPFYHGMASRIYLTTSRALSLHACLCHVTCLFFSRCVFSGFCLTSSLIFLKFVSSCLSLMACSPVELHFPCS